MSYCHVIGVLVKLLLVHVHTNIFLVLNKLTIFFVFNILMLY